MVVKHPSKQYAMDKATHELL